MAVLISKENTNLTSNGWYVKQDNATMTISSIDSYTSTSSAKYTAEITFANSCNLIGVILAVRGSSTRDLIVTLQENVSSNWIDRTSKTLTRSQLVSTNQHAIFFPYFEFSTPYAVDTTPAKWRFKIEQGTSGTGDHLLLYGDATKPYFITVCDYATATPTADDVLVVNHEVEANASLTLGRAVETSMIITHKGLFKAPTSPSGNIEITAKARIYISFGGKIRVGESRTNPYPSGYNFTINLNAESDAAGRSVIHNFGDLLFYGQKKVIASKLSGTANSGQPTITTTDETNWSAGDTVLITKAGNINQFEIRTISSVSGNNITLTSNLTYSHSSTDYICNFTRNVKLKSNTGANHSNYSYASVFTQYQHACSYYYTEVYNLSSIDNGSINQLVYTDNEAFRDYEGLGGYLLSNIYVGNSTNFPVTGNNRSYYNKVVVYTNKSTTPIYSGNNTFYNLFIENSYIFSAATNYAAFAIGKGVNVNIKNSVTSHMNIFYSLVGLTAENWEIHATSQSGNQGIYNTGTLVEYFGKNNLFRHTFWAGSEVGFYDENSTYSSFYASNTYKKNVVLHNCNASISISTLLLGSRVQFSNLNGIQNNDIVYDYAGYLVRTGAGLADTTVRTGGPDKFALRFQPTSSINNLSWSFTVPTGNIQGKTMSVAVWVKINSSNYYAGTHQKPRLTVNYDNGTEVYAEASATTNWQQLFVTFTPTTTYGQIIVSISGRTDATGSNAYFYVDDMTLLYPSNHSLDLGGLDNWANALPVTPPIAIPLSAYSVSNAVWEELLSSHTNSGTMGKKMNDLTEGKKIKYIVDGELPIYED